MVHIAIIGGGIGGLTAALALQQSGLEFEVFEQAPELLDIGAAIAIWPNAMRILQQLGIADRIIEQAGPMNEIRWVDQRGLLINQVSISDPKCPAVALHRADLQGTLLEALTLRRLISVRLSSDILSAAKRSSPSLLTATQ